MQSPSSAAQGQAKVFSQNWAKEWLTAVMQTDWEAFQAAQFRGNAAAQRIAPEALLTPIGPCLSGAAPQGVHAQMRGCSSVG